MRREVYLSEELLPPALYVKPPFFSKREIQCSAGAVLVSAVALAAIAFYIQPLAAVIAATCITAITSGCLVKKGLNYYSQITRDLEDADRALAAHLDRLTRDDIGKVASGFRQINRDIGYSIEGVGVKLAATLSEIDEMISEAERVTLVNCMDRLSEAMRLISEHHGNIPQSVVSRILDGNRTPLGIKSIMYVLESPQVSSSYSQCAQTASELVQKDIAALREVIGEMRQLREKYHELVQGHKQQLLKKKEELEALLREVSPHDDALKALVKVLKVARVISDDEAIKVLHGSAVQFSGTSSMHFVERFIVPYFPCLARAKKSANESYIEYQSKHAVSSKRSYDLNVLFERGLEVLNPLNTAYSAIAESLDKNCEEYDQLMESKHQLLCDTSCLLLEIINSFNGTQNSQQLANNVD